MAIITGQGATLEVGQESAWGTAAAPTTIINFLSESLGLNVERKEEDTLVGGVTSRNQDIMLKSVSGDFSLIAKPQNVGIIMGLALGVEAAAEPVDGTTGAYSHVFTPVHASMSDTLPSFTAIVNRHVAEKAYTGLKIGQLQIEAAAGDYMRMTVTCQGKDEVVGSSDPALTIPQLKAFRFAGGTCTFDGVEYGDVTKVSVTINNNLDEGSQTLGSGYYRTESEPQNREFTVSIDGFYSAATETVREQKYKTESTIAVTLRFESPSEIEDGVRNTIEIVMPRVVVAECAPKIAGRERLTLTIGGKALEPVSGEAVTVTLTDGNDQKYLA